MKRQARRFMPIICFILIVTAVFFASRQSTVGRFSILHRPNQVPSPPNASVTDMAMEGTARTLDLANDVPSPVSSESAPAISHETTLPADEIKGIIQEILHSSSVKPERLQCRSWDGGRYELLRKIDVEGEQAEKPIRYLFALDLRNCLNNLPRLLGSILEAIRFLGPRLCALSIVEDNSKDGTDDALRNLQGELRNLGIAYFLASSDIDPAEGDRIRKLADLRNLALKPLYDGQILTSTDTTVLFINDVVPCVDDLLELALQRVTLEADMTCAMDWTFVGPDPTFYDVWVSRTVHGDSFFEIPPDGNWNSAWNLFWNAPNTSSRYYEHRPFQVYSCWNGATAIGAQPFIQNVRFRSTRTGECPQGEPQLFAKDLWYKGFRKIAVIPAVNLEYSDKAAIKIKDLKGFTSDLVQDHTIDGDAIRWVLEPPDTVKCMPTWGNQYWEVWNKSLDLLN